MPYLNINRQSAAASISFEEALALIGDPDVRYTFEEASGNILNQGTAGASYDLTGNLPTTYGLDGPTADADSTPTAIALRHDDVPKTATGTSLMDLNSGSPSSTGSFACVFRCEWTEEDSVIRTIWSEGQGVFDGDFMSMEVVSFGDGLTAALRFRLQIGSAVADELIYNISAVEMQSISTHVIDGNWHLFVAVQDGTGVTCYYDGVEATVTESIGANVNASDWVDTLVSQANRRLEMGTHRATDDTSNSFDHFQGYIDDFMYWDGQQLTADDVANLWSGIEANVAGRGARESFMYALLQNEGTLPSHVFPLRQVDDNDIADMGTATNKIGDLTDQSTTPILADSGGPTPDSDVMTLNPGSHLSGELLAGSTASSPDFYSDTSGWLIFMYKHIADNTWNQQPIFIGNTANTFEDGEFKISIVTQGGNKGQMQFEFRNTSPNSKVFFYQGQNATGDEVDPTDGEWHLFVLYQPNDGGGCHLWVDRVEYDSSDSLFAIGTGTGYDDDVWFADLDADLSGTRRLQIGAQIVGGPDLNGIDGSICNFAMGDSAMTQEKVDRIADAVGLAA